MHLSFRQFLVRLLLFSVFTLALLILWHKVMPERFQSASLWAVWLFFVLSTAVIHYILAKAAEKEPRRFVGYFMGITAVKLFGYLIVIVAYAMIWRKAALGFTVFFLVQYLLYSGFEVVMLMKSLKK